MGGDNQRNEPSVESQQKAEKLLGKVNSGENISIDYNKMTSAEQKEVGQAMKNIKDSDVAKKFGYADISVDGEGQLQDAKMKRNAIVGLVLNPIDVFDTQKELSDKAQAAQEKLAGMLGVKTRDQQIAEALGETGDKKK